MNNYYGGPATDLIFGFPSRKERETVLPKKILPVKKKLYVCSALKDVLYICISWMAQIHRILRVEGLEVVRFQISTILLKCVF